MVRGLVDPFLQGVSLWRDSVQTLLHSEAACNLLGLFTRRVLWLSLIANALCLALLLPPLSLLLLLKLLPLAPTFSAGELVWSVATTWGSIFQFLWTVVPWCGLVILRYVAWGKLDAVFLGTLRNLDPNTAAMLSALTPEPATMVLLRSAQSSLKLLLLYPLPWLLGFVPGIGHLAWPITTVYLLQRRLGLGRAIVFGVLMAVPAIGAYASATLRAYFAVSLVARELLEPYLSRKPEARRRWWSTLARHEPLILGFAVPIYCLVSIPFIGPLAWIAAHGCAPVVMLAIYGSERDRTGSRDRPRQGRMNSKLLDDGIE